MSGHLFLTPRNRAEGHWLEAFPSARIVADAPAAVAATAAGTIVWVFGLDAARLGALHRERPELILVALSLQPDQAEALAMLEAGARGYCHALAAAEMLGQVAVVVANGGLWIGTELMQRAVSGIARATPVERRGKRPQRLDSLTPREFAVAVQVARGETNKEIAKTLRITERTVKAHLGAIFTKLQVRDRLQLALAVQSARPGTTPAKALSVGPIPPEPTAT